MKIIRKSNIFLLFLCSLIMFLLPLFVLASTTEVIPQLQLPVLLTSAGQCPQLAVLDIFANLAGLKYDVCSMPSIEMISAGVGLADEPNTKIGTDLEKYPKGTPYKTVFITMGASMKGMGAAGIDADFENKRVEKVVSWLKENNIYIVGVHVAGEDRRYHYLSEGMIDRVAPFCNLLIISNESNKDGRFTKISEEYDIPMILIDTEFDLPPIISELFGLQQ